MKNIVFLLILLIISCNDQSKRLNHALKLSKNNRSEIEQLLSYYDKSTLQYKAAVFLIENMPGHYSVTDDKFQSYYSEIENKYPDEPQYIKTVLHCLPQFYYDLNEVDKVEDIECVTSEFLVKHIDRMFELWQTLPWCKDVSFDVFCETILPYRVGNEPLSYIIEKYDSQQTNVLFRFAS